MATKTAIGATIVVGLIGLSFYLGRMSKEKGDAERAASRAADRAGDRVAERAADPVREPVAEPQKPKPKPKMINPEGIAKVTVFARACAPNGQCDAPQRAAATVHVSDPGGVFDKQPVSAAGAPLELRLPWGKFKLQAFDDQGRSSPLTEVELFGGKTITAELTIDR